MLLIWPRLSATARFSVVGFTWGKLDWLAFSRLVPITLLVQEAFYEQLTRRSALMVRRPRPMLMFSRGTGKLPPSP